jgi:hypothetical protein
MLKNKLSVLFEEDVTSGSPSEVTSSAPDFKTISDDEANKIIVSDTSEYKEFQKLYTTLEQSFEFAVHNPLEGSKTKEFPYHVLITNYTKSWENFPRILNRLLLSTSPNKDAKSAEETKDHESYNVIPFNKSMIVIGPKSKLTECFANVAIKLGMSFENFDDSLNIVLNIANNKDNTVEAESFKLVNNNPQKYNKGIDSENTVYKVFFTAVKKFDQFLKNDPQTIEGITSNMFNKENQDGAMSILEFLLAKNMNLTDVLDDLFNPEANNFKQIPFSKLVLGQVKDKTLWINNKCLVVKEASYEHLDFYKKNKSVTPNDQTNTQSDVSTDQDVPEDDQTTDEEIPVDDQSSDQDVTDASTDEEIPVDDEEDVTSSKL